MTRAALFARSLLLAAAVGFGASSAPADTPPSRQAGKVHFPISCSPEAQQRFDRAVAILHSFWYEEAVKEFAAVADTDPSCAMAQWGVAMSAWYPLWYPPSAAALKTGSTPVEKAQALDAKTDRERDYINAIGAFYKDYDTLDHRTRSVAYEKAMEQVYLRYPDDSEAGVFYALALDATAAPTDKSYANQKKAAAILEKVHGEQPDHPGVAHYLIHSYDSPPLAEQGLPAARSYAQIAPAVPHALHMPSHIFTRLGLWQESIDANRAAHDAARGYAQQKLGPDAWDAETLHTMDYLEYAYLQGAQDQQAKQVVDELATLRKGPPLTLPAAYAVAAIPARFALERRNWAEAAALAPPLLDVDLSIFPWAEGITAFSRALGAARSGDADAARTEIARLEAMRDKLTGAKNTYWASQVEVQRQAAAAMLAHAEGKEPQALELMRSAATLEASMEKHPATPGAVVPTRELLGDLLLDLDQPAEAMREYEATLAADPKRFRSVFGAAQAAEKSGDLAKARSYYESLAALTAKADTARPELQLAQAFLAKQ
ncbi:MAG TPA: hypothetical protein VF502_08640 [Stellaceae bacterium]